MIQASVVRTSYRLDSTVYGNVIRVCGIINHMGISFLYSSQSDLSVSKSPLETDSSLFELNCQTI